jgi:hypothetical protein
MANQSSGSGNLHDGAAGMGVTVVEIFKQPMLSIFYNSYV